MAQLITLACARAHTHTHKRAHAHAHTYTHTSHKQEWDTWLGTEMSSGRAPPREATVGSSYVYNVTGIAEPFKSSHTDTDTDADTHIHARRHAHTQHTHIHTQVLAV